MVPVFNLLDDNDTSHDRIDRRKHIIKHIKHSERRGFSKAKTRELPYAMPCVE